MKHQQYPFNGPHPGVLAIIFCALFIGGLSFVISFAESAPHYPGPWETGEAISRYFQEHSQDILMCAFFQFGSAFPLGILTCAFVNQLKSLGIRATGINIAFLGGFLASGSIACSSLILWVLSYPGIAGDLSICRALYYMVFAIGGVGYSVPLALLIASVSVTSYFARRLPLWLIVAGLLLSICGALSWLSLVYQNLLPLIPLTRFPAFIWLILVGFKLQRQVKSRDALARESHR